MGRGKKNRTRTAGRGQAGRRANVAREEWGKLVCEAVRDLGNPTVWELVEHLSDKHGVRFEEAAKHVWRAWKEGRIDLVEPRPHRNIISYAFSLTSLWFWAVVALVAATGAMVLYVREPPLVYARYVLGSLFVLYLPGATLVEALYPRGEDLEPLERLALSIGLSLAVVPLIGLVLNYTPWGIRLVPVLTSLVIFTQGMALVALARKYKYYRLGLRRRPLA